MAVVCGQPPDLEPEQSFISLCPALLWQKIQFPAAIFADHDGVLL